MLGRAHVIRLVTLGDQVLFSVGNFLLTILLGRYFSDLQLAAYGVGLSNALILQSTLRNCYIVQNSVLPAPVFARRSRGVMAQQLIIIAAVLLLEVTIFAACRSLAPAYFGSDVAIATVSCTLLYIQLEFERVVQLKQNRYLSPFVASLLYFSLNGAIFLAARSAGLSFLAVMSLQAFYALAKIGWLTATIGRPDFRIGWRLTKRDFRRYFWSSVVGAAGYSGFTHVPLLILNHYAAAVQVAAFVAIRGLTQPLQIVIKTLDLVDKNFFHAKSGGTPEGMRRLIYRQLAIYGALGIATVLVILVAGDWMIELIYRGKYAGMNGIYLGWGVIFGIMAVNAPLQTMVIRKGKVNELNHHRLYAGIAGMLSAWLLCQSFGGLGATLSIVLGWLVSSVFAVWVIRDVIFSPKAAPSKAIY